MQRPISVVLLVALAFIAFSQAVSVELTSQADLQAAVDLALLAEGDNLWYVKQINVVAPAPINATTGPFVSQGLYPVPTGKRVRRGMRSLGALEAIRKARQEERAMNETATKVATLLNAKLTPATSLVPAVVLPPAPANPLLPVNDTKGASVVVPVTPADLAKLKPVQVIGIPDKNTEPLQYAEYLRSQDTFGYLGLHPVAVGKRNATTNVKIAKVIGKEYAAGAVPTIPDNEKGAYTLTPVLMPGVVAPPPAPPANAPAVAPTLPPTPPAYAPNPPQPVPTFLQIEDMIQPMSLEESEMLQQAERDSTWSTLTAGVADMYHSVMDQHMTSQAQLGSMAADLAGALGAEQGSDAYTFLLSVDESIEPTAEEFAEVPEHHELAAEHGIPKVFKFVRSTRVLSNALDNANVEHAEQVANLEDKISLIQEAMDVTADERAELDTDAESETEAEFTPIMDAHARPAFIPSPVYSQTFKTEMGSISPRPRDPKSVWTNIRSLTDDTVSSPHPAAIRVVAGSVYDARHNLRDYSRGRGQSVYRLATKVENLLNKLARATIAERQIVARALNTQAYSRLTGKKPRSKKAIKNKKKSLKLSSKAAKSVKKQLKQVTKLDKMDKKLAKAVKKNASPAVQAIVKAALDAKAAAKKAVLAAKNSATAAKKALGRAAADPSNTALKTLAEAAVKKQDADKKAAKASIKAAKKAASDAKKAVVDEKKAKKMKKAAGAVKPPVAQPAAASKTAPTASNNAVLADRVAKLEALVAKLTGGKAPAAPASATPNASIKKLNKAAKKADKKAAKAEKKIDKLKAKVAAEAKKLKTAKSALTAAKASGDAKAIKAAESVVSKEKKAIKEGKKALKSVKQAKKAENAVAKKAEKAKKAVAKLAAAKASGNTAAVAKAEAKVAKAQAAEKKAAKKAKKVEKKAKKADKKAKKAAKTAKKIEKKAKKAVDFKVACPKAQKKNEKCKAKKSTSPKCKRAAKAVASKSCANILKSSKAAKKTLVESEAETEAESESELDAESLLEIEAEAEAEAEAEVEAEAEAEAEVGADADTDADVEVDGEGEVDVYDLKPSAIDNLPFSEDTAASDALARDITAMAGAALAEEVAAAKNTLESPARYNLDLSLPQIPTFVSAEAPATDVHYTVEDTMSQIAQALNA